MTSLLDDSATYQATSPAERLRITMAAARVSFMWLGVRKTLSPEQKAQAADSFGAQRDYLSAGKKLLDTGHPAFKSVTAIRGRIIAYWKGISLPYPEPGIRLIRQDDIAAFSVQMTSLKAELMDAVEQLDRRYDELKSAAQRRLGSLFNPSDYPTTLRGWFDVSYDFPSVEAPSYLQQLSPALYEQERARVAARFDEAVRLAEEAFVAELARLISHLSERLTGQDDGKPKVFRDSAIENLNEFFSRFRTLSVSSDQQLDDLVAQAQRTIRGVEPQELRDSATLRQRVATSLSAVGATLDGLMVDRPRRNLLRRRSEVA